MRWLALLLVVGCHTSSQKNVELDQHEVADEHDRYDASLDEREETSSGAIAEKTETKREEDAVIVQAPDGAITVARVGRTPVVLAPGSRVVGTVVLGSTTTNQDRQVGSATTTKTTEGNLAKTTDKEVTKDRKFKDDEEKSTDAGFGWKFYTFIIVLAVILLTLGGFAVRAAVRRYLGN